jgi:hypothetical protein
MRTNRGEAELYTRKTNEARFCRLIKTCGDARKTNGQAGEFSRFWLPAPASSQL